MSESAKKFSELTKEKKTFFLNGPWGSGKTEFLNKVRSEAKGKKYIDLNLWELKDERTVIHIGFSQLFFSYYIFAKIIFILSVSISILSTPAIDLGLEEVFPRSIIKIAGSIALVIAVGQFLKVKSDQLFYSILKSHRIDKFLEDKILVIDDFDRVPVDKQKEAYKLFNILHNRLPIIFVGDINKIAMNEDNYLQKIIDKRIDLPYVLHSRDIWFNYFSRIEDKFDLSLPGELINLFINENRNLRDRVQFNDYVNQEFLLHAKKDRVQCAQQLVVIYMYLFHYNKYSLLLRNRPLPSEKDYPERVFSELLQDNDDYPVSFTKNREIYFISESVNNMTEEEIKSILSDTKNLKNNILKKGSYDGDLYNYILKKYNSLGVKIQKDLLDGVLVNALDNNYSDLIKLIISFKKEEIRKESLIGEPDVEKRIYEKWLEILTTYEFDFSQKLKFIEKNSILSFKVLSELNPNIDVFSKEYQKQKEKLYYLLTYLSKCDLWEQFDKWSEDLWNKIDELYSINPNIFLLYFRYNRLIGLEGSRIDYCEENDSVKNYVVYEKIKSIDNPNIEVKGVKDTIEKIKPKLDMLSNLGYHFKYIEQK
ncbi:TPA: P-loop NTPase fold protein [Enterococcus faecium]